MARYDELLDSMTYILRATADETPEDIWNDFLERHEYNNILLTDSNMDFALRTFSKIWLDYVSKSGLISAEDETLDYNFMDGRLVQSMLCISAWMKVKKAYDIVQRTIKHNYHIKTESDMQTIETTFNEVFTKYCKNGFQFGDTVIGKF